MPISTVRSTSELRREIGAPPSFIEAKIVSGLTAGARKLIAHSALALVGTAAADGACDLTLWGGSPGSIRILDDTTLVLPDHQLRNALDRRFEHLASNGHVGLNLIVPPRSRTLRINGAALPTAEASLLCGTAVGVPAGDGLAPSRGIVVAIKDVYMHCGKALTRADAWTWTSWSASASVPGTNRGRT